MFLFDCVLRIWRFPRGAQGRSRELRERFVPRDLPPIASLRRLCILAMAATAWAPLIAGQQVPAAPHDQELPNAPGAEASVVTPDHGGTAVKNPAEISGTVLDTNGSEVQGAYVVLKSLTDEEVRSEQSGSNGEFTFTGLPPGSFKLRVSGPGWGTFVSPEIQLHAGDFHIVPGIVLPLTSPLW